MLLYLDIIFFYFLGTYLDHVCLSIYLYHYLKSEQSDHLKLDLLNIESENSIMGGIIDICCLKNSLNASIFCSLVGSEKKVHPKFMTESKNFKNYIFIYFILEH